MSLKQRRLYVASAGLLPLPLWRYKIAATPAARGFSAAFESGYILVVMERIRIEQHSFMGVLWFGAWLFTIGFLHLTFWKGVLAMALWPYYLGATFSPLLH